MARRPSRAWEAVLPVLALAALAVAGLAFFTDGDPAIEPAPAGPTVAAIASDPDRYDGQPVTLTATVEEPARELAAGADGAFVVTGEEARRVLVIPRWEGTATRLEEGQRVEVRGVVRAPPAAADEQSPETPPLTRADLIGRTGADAVVADAQIRTVGR